ncbi:MAG: nodulation protein NfeD [Candidatus Bathyarchaeia archaeon]|nr:nodulation protein NfeD [Candidatus Bathyarchaeota archaeon]
MRKLIIFLLFLFILIYQLNLVFGFESNQITVIKLEDAITPATKEFIQEAYKFSLSINAQAIIVLLNTPGGQLDATIKIIEIMEKSEIPWIVYVYPEGSRAWSAGAFILVSSHVAVMAPYTIVGSAQPVSYSPFEGSTPVEDEKIINALSAFIAEEARMHNRNATAAELFVRKNLNLNADEAYQFKVIDAVIPDINELLKFLNNKTVKTSKGLITLKTDKTVLIEFSPSIKIMFLSIISNPLLAYILFTLGLYGLIFGLLSPGYGAELTGAIALILGLIGLGFNVNLASLILIGLGVILMLIEMHTPGFGVLGGAGLICLIIGGLLLIPFTFKAGEWLISPVWYQSFIMAALLFAVFAGGFMVFSVYKVLKAKRMKPLIGELIGETVDVIEDLTPEKIGFVIYKGEYWRAKSKSFIKAGSKALIIGKEGPILIVEPKQS